MKTRFFGLSRFAAATSATVITALGAWAFVSSSASIERERDLFQFASIMAANATVQVAHVQSRTVSTCPNNPEARDPLVSVCLGG